MGSGFSPDWMDTTVWSLGGLGCGDALGPGLLEGGTFWIMLVTALSRAPAEDTACPVAGA